MPAFLLLHGFTGSPFEMRPVEKALRDAGFSHIRLPVLPGHCEDIISFQKSRFTHWRDFVERELRDLQKRHSQCIIIGLSMGGSLCLHLAQRFEVSGVVTIASPIYLYRLFPWEGAHILLPFVGILRHICPVIRTSSSSQEASEIAPFGGYEGFYALNPLYSLIKGLREIKKGLHRITAPILIIHSPQDRSVPVSNAWGIAKGVNSKRRTIELLQIKERITTGHILTTHRETSPWVKRYIVKFCREILGH